ncbi:MAG: hypothetical protein A2381_04640 [Bdellovibrionales bacterium RIFOXYB1_FULL_37_110]|nr:MAG: hypothetical protein A2181_01070 [Bdellovibrionales bacterium RIFOXYA1_FULL_38_20]OFZ50473.1 MAG: hypothetical protein A2417_10620 [Bdellovibrionales bacterium RIFOXYC1_FULL_37_79]OFZ56680.1 MAG: hypothetical protein A2328_09380 [Bdellovibrionales bacterium RIFOXYB2_FULL_36_6]OFZ60744.1 MAG: hypothetical protein A2381_04640 [Bdellovibrionales bacterium RIFOXYB1_FULL_37_110]
MNKKNKTLKVAVTILVLMLFHACSTSNHISTNTADQGENSTQLSEAQESEYQSQLAEAEANLSKHIDNILKNNNADEITFYASDLYLKATDSAIRGDSQIAVLLYKNILKLTPDMHVKKKYAIELIKTGELTESLEILQEVYQKEKDENIGLVIGGVHTATGNKKEARRIYNNILKSNPKNAEACIFLAKSLLADNEYDRVNQTLVACKKQIKNDPSFAFYQGKIALNRNRKEDAQKYFIEALKTDSKYHQAAIALGLMLEEKERYEEAKKVYKTFLDHTPDNLEVLTRMVQILFLKEKSDKIIPLMERIANLDPTDLNSKVKLGVLYTDIKEYQKAKGIFKEILVAAPDSDKVLYYLGSLCQELGEYEEAIAYFNKISPESELFGSGNIEIAKMLYVLAVPEKNNEIKNVELEKFITFVREKSSSHPSLKVDLYFNLATYYESRLDFSKAIELISEIKSLKEYTLDHDYYLASLFEKKGDLKRSREIVYKIIETDPNNAHALNFLGYSLMEKDEDLKLAYEYISKAIKIKPEDGYIRDSLGWYYFKTGNLKKSLEELKKARKNESNDSVINQHLAIVYQKLKYYDMAKKYFVEALKNCKDNQGLKNQIVQALEDLERLRLPASK